jgi:DHA1 family bicyclomycin/chloramphenicol resistance-like MFS transporter
MNPDARTLWQAPSWALAFLLACLGMLGPFSIDAYLPAFTGIAQAIGATPVEMQQTLSAYLFGFAIMNLFHGALADSFGRRPVVLAGLAVFTLASVGCALAQHIGVLVFFRALQGMSAGAGIVVSRTVIRDMFPPADAQRVMSQVTIYFGIAPAVAPMIGGFLFVHAGWHAVFWMLTVLGVALFVANWKLLPETLHATHKQPFNTRNLLRGYWSLAGNPRFLMLALASGIPFNGMFLYVLSAPVFLGDTLGLGPGQFFWFFALTIGGIMAGAFLSGRMAGRVKATHQIRYGFLIMAGVGALNLVLNVLFVPEAWWALAPIALYGFGWALMVPVVTLMVLDLLPERRGMASSLQAFVGSSANGLVAGAVAPLVMHSAPALAATSLAMLGIGVVAWLWVKPHLRVAPSAAPRPLPDNA